MTRPLECLDASRSVTCSRRHWHVTWTSSTLPHSMIRPLRQLSSLLSSVSPRNHPRSHSMSSPPSSNPPNPSFQVSPIPKQSSVEGRYIRTAAALIIGCARPFHSITCLPHNKLFRDEILNGKTLDRNSHFFARYCFEQGVELCVLCYPIHRCVMPLNSSPRPPPESG